MVYCHVSRNVLCVLSSYINIEYFFAHIYFMKQVDVLPMGHVLQQVTFASRHDSLPVITILTWTINPLVHMHTISVRTGYAYSAMPGRPTDAQMRLRL